MILNQAKTRSGDHCVKDQATLRDFFLSLQPPNLFMAVFNIIYTLLWGWFMWTIWPLSESWEARLGAGSLIHLLFLAWICTRTVAMIANWLRDEVFFTLHIASCWIALFFVLPSVFKFEGSAQISAIVYLIWLILNILVLSFSSKGLRIWYFPWWASRRMRPLGFPPRQPGRHRILLIDPANLNMHAPLSPRRRNYPSILPYVAALVPKNWDVMLLDQVYDEIDFEMDVDVVGFTSMGVVYNEIRELALGFKKQNRTVIVGGPDCSLQPQTYESFTDAILVGNAEGLLPTMLSDWENRTLKKQYLNSVVYDLKNMNLPRYDLLPFRRYGNIHTILISTSCPYHCNFCNYNRTREPRLRPTEEVLKAVQATPSKYFWFEAPELLAYKKYVLELERTLSGSGIEFLTHTTMRSAADEETVRAARSSGLRGVWLGVESFNQQSLNFANKKQNQVANYQQTFDLLDKYGIQASVHLMFGFPHDSLEDFEPTLNGLIKGRASMVEAHLMSVYSGDEKFEQTLIAAGGVELTLLEGVRQKADITYTFYRPSRMSDSEFCDFYESFQREFFSFENIFKRLLRKSIRNLPNLVPDLCWNIYIHFYRRTTTGQSFEFKTILDETFYFSKIGK